MLEAILIIAMAILPTAYEEHKKMEQEKQTTEKEK